MSDTDDDGPALTARAYGGRVIEPAELTWKCVCTPEYDGTVGLKHARACPVRRVPHPQPRT